MAGTAPEPPVLDANGLRIAICASRFNGEVTGLLVDGAIDAAKQAGAEIDGPHWVAGALELPLIASALAVSGADAVVAIGCVIRGETPHFDLVAGESARGIMRAMLDTGTPIGDGIITVEDRAQAEARAGGDAGNKGAEAAYAALEAALVLRRIAGGTR